MRPIATMSSRTLLLLLGLSAPAAAVSVTLPCPWCTAGEAPATLTATGRLASAGEPGIPLEITGTVYNADGRTPAAGVLVYAAQVNANGVYQRGGNTGEGQEHPDLRAWALTDAEGRYRFYTVRPAHARGTSAPASILMTVKPRGGHETLIDPIEFDDDALLTADVRTRRARVGGVGVVHALSDARGVLHATRDIRLAQ